MGTDTKVRPVSATYWRSIFGVIFIPFIFCIPYHVLRSNDATSPNLLLEKPEVVAYKRLRQSWFRSFTKSPCFAFLTILLAFLCISCNGYILTRFGWLLYDLLILGTIPSSIITDVYEILLSLPLLFFVVYVWIFGYQLKYTIKSFDCYKIDKIFASNVFFSSCRGGEFKENKLGGGGHLNYRLCTTDDVRESIEDYNCKKKLLVMYVAILGTQALHSLLSLHSFNVSEGELEVLRESLVNVGATIQYTLSLPLYACFCWGIQSQVACLSSYMNFLLAHNVKLMESHVLTVRASFKVIATNVVHVNRLYRLYLSAVLFILSVVVTSESYEFLYNFVGSIVNKDLMSIIASLLTPRNVSSAPETGPGSSAAPEAAFMLDPKLVRVVLGQVFYLVLLFGLLFWIVWEAYVTNNNIRSLQVYLNDFAIGVSADAISAESHLFKAVSLLKSYMLSRMEDGQQNRAQLEISAVTLLPFARSLFTGKTVWH